MVLGVCEMTATFLALTLNRLAPGYEYRMFLYNCYLCGKINDVIPVRKTFTRIIVVCALFAGFTACNNVFEPKEPEPVEFYVSLYEVSLAVGADTRVDIFGGTGEYYVIQGDEAVATAILKDNMLVIFSTGIGDTSITVSDGESYITIPVTVKLYWYKQVIKIDTFLVSVSIEDKVIKQKVEESLLATFPFPEETTYVLAWKNGDYDPHDLFIYPADDKDKIIEGSFVSEAGMLTFFYEGTEIAYSTSFHSNCIYLTEDLTNYYREIYPETHVGKVLRAQLSYPVGNIIE